MHRRRQHGPNLPLLALLGAVGGLYLVGKRERPERRIPAIAAIDAPAVTNAWLTISNLPHFQCFRSLFMRRALQGRREARVLDVGCGVGQLTRELAVQPEVKTVTGIDLSPDLVEQARSITENRGIDAQFLLADAAEMPFADGEFDVVVSTLSLHHWEQPEAVLREIYRVLAPGGTALVADLRRDAPAVMVGMLAMLTRYIVPAPVRQAGEPLASLQAAYTPCEAILLTAKAGWHDPRASNGPAWLQLSTVKPRETE